MVTAQERICRSAVTAAVTAKQHFCAGCFQRCLQGNRRFGLVTKELVSKQVSTETKVFRLVRMAQVRKLVRKESPVLLALKT